MSPSPMHLIISTEGVIVCLYSELIDVAELGDVRIERASRIDAAADGRWYADLSPSSGPKLGPFHRRSEALAAEISWLDERLPIASRESFTH